ncbi:MAG: hypothetical protein FGM33_05620 [Candidatus Kapabacteria bacterium]|nr:hypothetical protein [Candidatus Kapabacteria bacterium]
MSPLSSVVVSFVFGLSCIALSACGDNIVTNPNDIIFPDTNVSFRAHVLPFIALSCGIGGCHADVNPAAGIRLTSYSTLMFDRGNLIVPGKPDESLVIQVLNGTFSHPWGFLQERVTTNHRLGMIQWVREGALNN